VIRALIVDDEPLARERIRGLLADEPDIRVVGECGDGEEAASAIETLAPQLVFLDVQMPGLTGFEVLDRLGVDRVPAVIFVTAYDQYALDAFDMHAIDYLLKPFDGERFRWALDRARRLIGSGTEAAGEAALAERLRALLADVDRERHHLKRLAVKAGGRVYFLQLEQIEWIEAAGNYARLHEGGRSHLVRTTLKRLVEKLDPDRFVRISRSTIVNLDFVRELQPWVRGGYVVVLKSGMKHRTGRTYRENVNRLLEDPQ
jgi:two-component system LytT family response regulator